MTPEEAKTLIDGIDPRNEYHMWADFQRRYDPHTVYDALHTIAGLVPVYSYDVWCGDHWSPMDYEFTSLEAVRDWLSTRERQAEARIITRLVTEWEVVPDGT